MRFKASLPPKQPRVITEFRMPIKPRENLIDHLHDDRRGTIALNQMIDHNLAVQILLHFIQYFSHPSTPPVDRLLDVANAKQGTLWRRGNLFGNRLQNPPLNRTCILEFIQQEVLNWLLTGKWVKASVCLGQRRVQQSSNVRKSQRVFAQFQTLIFVIECVK